MPVLTAMMTSVFMSVAEKPVSVKRTFIYLGVNLSIPPPYFFPCLYVQYINGSITSDSIRTYFYILKKAS